MRVGASDSTDVPGRLNMVVVNAEPWIPTTWDACRNSATCSGHGRSSG